MFKFGERYLDERFFASDSLNKGRIIKNIFKELTYSMMELAEDQGKKNEAIYGLVDYPFWYSEEKTGWMLPVFFQKKGFVVWTEWSEDNIAKDSDKKAIRKIDFFVGKKDLDIFIELKKIGGRLGGGNILYSDGVQKLVSKKHPGTGLLDQIYNMKAITPEYNNNKVLAGILIVHSTILASKFDAEVDSDIDSKFTTNARKLMDEVNRLIDGRRNMQLLGSHTIVNWAENDVEELKAELNIKYIPKMLSIIGVFCSPKT